MVYTLVLVFSFDFCNDSSFSFFFRLAANGRYYPDLGAFTNDG